MITTDLSTDIGRVRFALDDTDEGGRTPFTDAEVSFALSTGGSVNGAIVVLLRKLIASRARRASFYAEPQPGSPEPDDAAQLAALRELLSMYGGDSVAVPRATFGSLGSSPSDGDACRPLLTRCGC